MRRKFYANLESGHEYTRIIGMCECGGRLFEYGRYHPAPYIVVPPYKRVPPQYQAREEWRRRWCDSCFLDESWEKR